MKSICIVLICMLQFACGSNSGYSPAFEADRVFKTEIDKLTYLSKKYEIPSFYFTINPACK
ncbi:MAG: hypothetical protein IT280_04545 [Ignavibacteria bacterium]|nr:hypothetical protein [Ignavibacteria bacterium]